MQRTCLVCGKDFVAPGGIGRPPETCSPDCFDARRREQRAASQGRALERGIPESAHGTSTGYTYFRCPCGRCRRWAREYKQAQRVAAAAVTAEKEEAQ